MCHCRCDTGGNVAPEYGHSHDDQREIRPERSNDTRHGHVGYPRMTSTRTVILVADAVIGWVLGNVLAMALVVAHPVHMSASLLVRNVFVAGLVAGVLITLLITGARDAHRLGLLNRQL